MGVRLSRRVNTVALALAVLPAGAGYAGTSREWNGDILTSPDWSVASNWSPLGVPASGDSVSIIGSGIFGILVDYDYTGAAVTLNSVTIGATMGELGVATVASLSITANNITSNYEYVGDSGTLSNTALGAINQSGGTNSISGQTNSTLYLGFNPTDTGTYNLSGNGVVTATNVQVGGTGTGTFNQSGGTGNYGQLVVGDNGGTGTYNLSGNGAINASGETIGSNAVGDSQGTFTMNGGINKTGGLGVGIEAAGTYTQYDGATKVTGNITVGQNVNAFSSSFTVYAGTVSSSAMAIGVVGDGIFTQSGGTITTGQLMMGLAGGMSETGDGSYTLSGGTLNATSETICVDGSGEIFQTGGSNIDSGGLFIPDNGGSGGAAYTLNGGNGSAMGTVVGESVNQGGSGQLTIAGTGVFTDPVGITIDTKGTLALQGGTLNAASVSVSGGAFSWTSGTLNIIGAGGLTIDTGQLLGKSFTLMPGKNLGVTATLTINGAFTNDSNLSVNNVVNAGFFTSDGQLTDTGLFTNSATAIIGGTQSWAHGSTFSNTAGTAVFQSDAGSAASSTIAVNVSGGVVGLANPQHWAGLTISGGILDIADNHVILSYGASDPRSTILSYLKSGSAGGTWDGSTGILSFTAAVSGGQYGVGFGDGADSIVSGLAKGQIEIAHALNGDINLDGVVNGTDFADLGANFGSAVSGGWEQGDFNYDGLVNGTDFALLASNFGDSVSGAAVSLPAADWAALDSFAASNGLMADVPEPACAGLMMLGLGGALGRRRRGRFSQSVSKCPV